MLNVYAIYDEKALSYGIPFFAKTDGIAKRLFADLCDDPQSTVYKHPSDFKLYYLGEFDESTADLVPNARRVWLATGYVNEFNPISAEITE